jgi:RNA polymerase sigma factor (sigma-70 family)
MTAETDFRAVFSHLGAVANYARRRGSADADALAAEVMTIAWRRLPDVPTADPLPWLFVTARNLLRAEFRTRAQTPHVAERDLPAPEMAEVDPQLRCALLALSPLDREALLLVAWEDLSPSQAARALGINPAAFRVRLLRARRRLRSHLEDDVDHGVAPLPVPKFDVEGS